MVDDINFHKICGPTMMIYRAVQLIQICLAGKRLAEQTKVFQEVFADRDNVCQLF